MDIATNLGAAAGRAWNRIKAAPQAIVTSPLVWVTVALVSGYGVARYDATAALADMEARNAALTKQVRAAEDAAETAKGDALASARAAQAARAELDALRTAAPVASPATTTPAKPARRATRRPPQTSWPF